MWERDTHTYLSFCIFLILFNMVSPGSAQFALSDRIYIFMYIHVSFWLNNNPPHFLICSSIGRFQDLAIGNSATLARAGRTLFYSVTAILTDGVTGSHGSSNSRFLKTL